MDRKSFANVFLYFIIAILLVGTIGVWLPVLINLANGDVVNEFDIYQNTATYFITILVAGCLELILNIIEKLEDSAYNTKGYVLLLILLILISIALIVTISFAISFENKAWSKVPAIFGVLFAWVIWWISNYDNDTIKATNALGGEPK
jgi:hypothetical protein